MQFTKKQINNCRNLHDCVNTVLLGKFFRSPNFDFDFLSFDKMIEPLPVETQEKLRLHVKGLVRIYRNIQLHGKKLSSTSVNRRIARLELELWHAEEQFNQQHAEVIS